ncbi:MAG: glycoside hydrolase family 2 protein [Promethearchaeota archaeon]
MEFLKKFFNLNENEKKTYNEILTENDKTRVIFPLLKSLNEEDLSKFYNTFPNGTSDFMDNILKTTPEFTDEEIKTTVVYLLNTIEKAKIRANKIRDTTYEERVHENLITKWGSKIDPSCILPEYPRPQMKRDKWLNLNGYWEYSIKLKDENAPNNFDGKILVPFPIESYLSGIQTRLTPKEKLWYRKEFTVPSKWNNSEILLNFGAVDWKTTVWVNHKLVGVHKGGYMPFSFNITQYINQNESNESEPNESEPNESEPDKNTPNEIVISVWDPTTEGMQQKGKQHLNPSGIRYTAVTGIWQTVWLEPVPRTRIQDFKIIPDIDKKIISVAVNILNSMGNEDLKLRVFEKGKEISQKTEKVGKLLEVEIENPKLWNPSTPFLYDLQITLNNDGKVVDKVDSYFGMRKIGMHKDKNGVLRIELNNSPIFQYGTLDQGWWPDGLYTAPSDEALKFDIEITKKMDFNMIRKHVKVESARWYYHCDRIGILVWQDFPNGGVATKRDMKRKLYGSGRDSVDNRKEFYEELESMINFLFNSPSVVTWVPFNESWGQFETSKITKFIKNLDKTKLVESASGWWDLKVGDIRSYHDYPGPKMPPLEEKRSIALTEFGGLGLQIEDHLWFKDQSWGYRNMKDKKDLLDNYSSLIEKLVPMVKKGLSAAIYTQTTDCEGEVNGLLTYDRKVIKMPIDALNRLHDTLYQLF